MIFFSDWWRDEFNSLLHKDFGVSLNIPAVFIDTFYNPRNLPEVQKFSQNVQELISFASTR